MNNYSDWEDFADLYLEDSFDLSIDESKDEISFTIEAVLMVKKLLQLRVKS